MCPLSLSGSHVGTLAPHGKYDWTCASFSPPESTTQTEMETDRFSRFCTSHSRKSLYFAMDAPFPKLSLPMGDLDPHLTYESLGQSKPTTQTASLLVQLFYTDDHSVPILYNGSSLPPLKTAPSHEGMLTPSNTWFLGSIPVLNQNISVSQLPFLQGWGLTTVTDQQTDRPTDRPHYSVCNNRPHLCM